MWIWVCLLWFPRLLESVGLRCQIWRVSGHYLFEHFFGPVISPLSCGDSTSGHGWGWLWSFKTQEATVRFRRFVILWTRKRRSRESHRPTCRKGAGWLGRPLSSQRDATLLEAVLYSEGLGRPLHISSGRPLIWPSLTASKASGLPTLSCGRITGCWAFVRLACAHAWEGGGQSSPCSLMTP